MNHPVGNKKKADEKIPISRKARLPKMIIMLDKESCPHDESIRYGLGLSVEWIRND